jgi:hypothetical protein
MTPDLGFVLGLAFASAILARTAAGKRNRNVALWGVICFCCPIALVVIWSLDRLPPRQELPPTMNGTASQNLPVSK